MHIKHQKPRKLLAARLPRRGRRTTMVSLFSFFFFFLGGGEGRHSRATFTSRRPRARGGKPRSAPTGGLSLAA